jgi:hypothetical protein
MAPDIRGKTVLTPVGGSAAEKTTYTFQLAGLVPDANGVIKKNGAAFFHTASTTGRLASSINNLVVISKDDVRQGKVGGSMNVAWEWK